MDLQSMLGEMPLARFVADYYYRLPFSATGLARPLCEVGGWQTLTALLAHESADTLVCRRNEQYTGQAPRTVDDAQRLVDDGYTLLVRHAEQLHPRLGELADSFSRAFAAPVNIHVYCTPGGEFGFGWHYDAEEVFIVQTTGRKQYSLRKNTVNPWPIEETLPADMHYEREIMPLMRCELAAGDWLYIPSGYWHMGDSRETAISFSIGVQPRTGVDVFEFLRPQIVESIFWRQRLPVCGEAASLSNEELHEQYREVFKALAADISRLMAEPRNVALLLDHLRAKRSALTREGDSGGSTKKQFVPELAAPMMATDPQK